MNSHNLKPHLMKHIGKERYKRDRCEYSTNGQTNLKTHNETLAREAVQVCVV